MGARPRVSRKEVYQLLDEGHSAAEIAKPEFWHRIKLTDKVTGVKHQAISLIKKDWEKAKKTGTYIPGRKNGHKHIQSTKGIIKQLADPEKIDLNILENLNNEQLDNITVRIIQWAYQYQTMKERIEKLESQIASVKNDNKILAEKNKKQDQRAATFEAAKRGTLVTPGD